MICVIQSVCHTKRHTLSRISKMSHTAAFAICNDIFILILENKENIIFKSAMSCVDEQIPCLELWCFLNGFSKSKSL